MRDIVIGGTYQHFKGGIYQVLDVAKDSETSLDVVIYKNLANDSLWVRNKDMFLSEVDHEKYPNVTQKWRFELIK